MEASPLSNLATDRRKGSTAAGAREGKRVALWLPGYPYVLCCKLVRVRMHHGPMGRSMDHGDGCGCMYGLDGWMDGWVVVNGRRMG